MAIGAYRSDVSLRDAETTLKWSNPTLTPVNRFFSLEARNTGTSGSVTFVLQRLVSGDDWQTLSSSTIEISWQESPS